MQKKTKIYLSKLFDYLIGLPFLFALFYYVIRKTGVVDFVQILSVSFGIGIVLCGFLYWIGSKKK